MASVNEVYKLALENRTAINTIKDLAKATDDFTSAGALLDPDVVRISRGGESLKTTVGDLKAASGGGDTNVKSNWLETDSQNDAFIQNKPQNLSDFNNDLTVLGDMKKDIYDTDNSGVVNNAEKLNGEVPATYDQRSHVADNTIHVTSAQSDALDGANAPSNGNVFATMLDLNSLSRKKYAKHPNNSNPMTLEANDIVYDVWWTSALYIKCMRYDGGDVNLIASYTILDSIEF